MVKRHLTVCWLSFSRSLRQRKVGYWGLRASLTFTAVMAMDCGARSAFPALEPCFESGATRGCVDDCGGGIQHCSAGYWQKCEVPTKTRACADNCGSGTQQCTGSAWSACVVEPTTRACTNNCGDGTQLCTNDTWGICQVQEKTAACANDCGPGTKTCDNNVWTDCSVTHQEKACSSVCGPGKQTCDNNKWTDCDAPQPLPPTLHATIRDFRNGIPIDFDPRNMNYAADDRGYVQSLLGSDDTPVYALSGSSRTVQSADTFYQWYHDVSGVNQSTTIDLPLTKASDQSGLYVYDNQSFFPIDGQLFGNEGLQHNYSFTLASSAQFTFVGNEKFTFTGDDDVFVFINRHLAIDLGGIHEAETQTVDLVANSQQFEIVPGNRYPIHIFFAERHPVYSHFLVETSIADIGACPSH